MSDPVRVLLIDDHNLFRSGIRSLLQRYSDICVVGEAGDATEGIKRAGQLEPDVILLDLHMPGLSGVDAARLILEEHPNTQILTLTVSEEAEDLFDALKAGACGYLLKNIEAETLAMAIRTAAKGESVISPHMMDKLLAGIRGVGVKAMSRVGSKEAPNPEIDALTRRESEILEYLARGQSNKEIARALDIAESTVKIHVQNLLRKLGLSSRVQAAVFAVEHGFGVVPPSDDQAR